MASMLLVLIALAHRVAGTTIIDLSQDWVDVFTNWHAGERRPPHAPDFRPHIPREFGEPY